MKFLLTGITGFAGPHLANLLIENGHEVYGLIRRTNGMETDILDVVPQKNFEKIKFLIADLREYRQLHNIFKEHKFDGIFHLAAMSHPPTSFKDPIGTFQDNIIGSANLIQTVSDTQKDTCRFHFVSTSEVYGNEGIDGRLITEDEKIMPSNPYGISKAATDLYLQERFSNKLLRGFITRAFSHCGTRRGKNFSISCDAYNLATIKKRNLEPILGVGNLETTRVVIDVKDCVKAYYELMVNDNTDGLVFNICGDTPRKMQFFTDKLIEISGIKNVEKRINPAFYRPIDIHYQHGSTKLLKSYINWEPTIPIETTLTELYNYWLGKID